MLCSVYMLDRGHSVTAPGQLYYILLLSVHCQFSLYVNMFGCERSGKKIIYKIVKYKTLWEKTGWKTKTRSVGICMRKTSPKFSQQD